MTKTRGQMRGLPAIRRDSASSWLKIHPFHGTRITRKLKLFVISRVQHKHWCHHKHDRGKSLLMTDWWLFIRRHWTELKWDKCAGQLDFNLLLWYHVAHKSSVRVWETEFQRYNSFSTRPSEFSLGLCDVIFIFLSSSNRNVFISNSLHSILKHDGAGKWPS